MSVVQVLRGGDLRRQHALDLLRGERGDRPVVEHARGVHHGGQRDAIEHGGQRVAIGDVAGSDLGARAQVTQGRQQLERTVGVRAAAREQQQVADAVDAHEMLGDERAEPARAARDQDGPVAERGRGVGRVDAFQPRREQPAGAQRELRLVGEQHVFAVDVE